MTQAIFLSYASQDADAARRICDALRTAGLEVWFDQSELRGGDAWDASIRKQIKECALFVPIISDNTNARPEGYFRLEWKLAVDRSHLLADDQPFFVPVILDDTKEATARVPEKFRERQWTRLGTQMSDDASTLAFAARIAKLTDGSGSSGKNASSSPSNNETSYSETTSNTGHSRIYTGGNPDQRSSDQVGADRVPARLPNPAGTMVPEQPNLDPGLPLRGHRDDSVTSSASREKLTDTAAVSSTQPLPAAIETSPTSRRTTIITTVAIAFALACAATAWFVIERQRNEAFITQSLTKIEDLSRRTKYMDAHRLADEVERAGGAALLTDAVRETYSRAIDITSTPEGATIAFRQYALEANDQGWIEIGKAPMTKVRVPHGVLEWRATQPNRVTHTLVATTGTTNRIFTLPATDAKDAGLLPVPEFTSSITGLIGMTLAKDVKVKAFAIERTEVTNRQYAAFLQAGGYTREEFWKHPFQDGAKVLSFGEATARFKDTTGRAGPATWRLGSFPDGEGELPVRGISWFEASAYAAFAGRSLPTIYHWYFADSGNDTWALIPALLPGANFAGVGSKAGPRAANSSRTISRFGAIDMAGNVREWVANPTDKGRRIAVGGSWLEVHYQYRFGSQFSAFDRPLDVGFRCMSKAETATPDIAFAPVQERTERDVKSLVRVSDAEYAIYARFFEQSRVPLDARIEATDTSKPYWTRMKVSYAAGYNNERMNAYLYLPKNAAPPFQTVIYMPGSGVFDINKPYDEIGETAAGNWQMAEMLIRGGRAVFYPIWKRSFERGDKSASRTWTRAYFRAVLPQWVSEMRQSVEFLRSQNQVSQEKIGYFGFSLGAAWAPNLLAFEPRVNAAVLLAGGLEGTLSNGETLPPEIDMATYAPRVKSPVIMLNGRSDIRFPYETSQVPLFNLLGSPANKKKHNTYPGGHSLLGWYDAMAKDTHDWFDEHFGPVKPVALGATPTNAK